VDKMIDAGRYAEAVPDEAAPIAYRRLSVVIPCYNEAPSLKVVLDRVLDSPYTGEVIVVDDGSTDETLRIAQSFNDPRVRTFAQPINIGKGAALRRGFKEARLDYVIVQDADLEYDPHDYGRLLAPLVSGEADVVYGSRFIGGEARRVLYFWHSLGNRLLTNLSNALTNLNLTDMETCYKVFLRHIIQSMDIEEDRFGFEPEITAKVAARGLRVFEVGISYNGRTYAEGKKIVWKDGLRALYCMARYSTIWPTKAVERFDGRTPSESALSLNLTDLDEAALNYTDWIVSLCEPHLGNHVLEIGGGHGTITSRLSVPSRRIVTTEISQQSIAILRDRFETAQNVTVEHCAEFELPAGKFTSVLMINVLEHIAEDEEFLALTKTRLSSGGNIVVFAPAFSSLYSDFDRRIGHYRRYTRSELTTKLTRCGFSVIESRYVNSVGALAWWLVARQLGRIPTTSSLTAAYDKVFVPLVSRLERNLHPPFGQSVFVVGKKTD